MPALKPVQLATSGASISLSYAEGKFLPELQSVMPSPALSGFLERSPHIYLPDSYRHQRR
ncbi:MAG: hypothetical protein HC925_09185 [Coleofasciculaceae cyanobacterium SM2_3_26]|nr:hypothetical protein [Coleofasciculaceae cyanobacterium SM2_3_26]